MLLFLVDSGEKLVGVVVGTADKHHELAVTLDLIYGFINCLIRSYLSGLKFLINFLQIR